MRWLSATDGAFPPHRVPLGWALILLVGPLPVLAAVRHEPFVAAIATTLWLSLCIGLAAASLLDWSRRRTGQQPPTLRLARHVARLFIAALGAAGVVAGVALAIQALRGARHEHMPLVALLFRTAFGLMIGATGAQLMALPFREAK